jgi:hypothetical protein
VVVQHHNLPYCASLSIGSAVADGADGEKCTHEVHGCGIGKWKHERSAGIACRADGTEQISVSVPLILRLAWTRPLLGPLVDQPVFLADPHFILEPDFDRQSSREQLAR